MAGISTVIFALLSTVGHVRYPSLPGHPQADLIARQMAGTGALISFELKGGIEVGRKVLGVVCLLALAVSLGGVESLIQHPASMTPAAVKAAAPTRGHRGRLDRIQRDAPWRRP